MDNLLTQIEQHGEPFMFAAAVPQTLTVAGGQLTLGLVLHVMHSTQIANLDHVQAWRLTGTGDSIDVRLKPATNKDMTVRTAPAGNFAAHRQPLAS